MGWQLQVQFPGAPIVLHFFVFPTPHFAVVMLHLLLTPGFTLQLLPSPRVTSTAIEGQYTGSSGPKPMALNAQQAKEMLDAAEQAGVKHMIMFSWRFFPHYQYMQQLIADGYLGRSYHCHIRFLSNAGRQKQYKWAPLCTAHAGAISAATAGTTPRPRAPRRS